MLALVAGPLVSRLFVDQNPIRGVGVMGSIVVPIGH